MTGFRIWFDDHSHWFFLCATVAALLGGSLIIVLSMVGVH
jgi:hypothetical protein